MSVTQIKMNFTGVNSNFTLIKPNFTEIRSNVTKLSNLGGPLWGLKAHSITDKVMNHGSGSSGSLSHYRDPAFRMGNGDQILFKLNFDVKFGILS